MNLKMNHLLRVLIKKPSQLIILNTKLVIAHEYVEWGHVETKFHCNVDTCTNVASDNGKSD